jgi:hypothetical protein
MATTSPAVPATVTRNRVGRSRSGGRLRVMPAHPPVPRPSSGCSISPERRVARLRPNREGRRRRPPRHGAARWRGRSGEQQDRRAADRARGQHHLVEADLVRPVRSRTSVTRPRAITSRSTTASVSTVTRSARRPVASRRPQSPSVPPRAWSVVAEPGAGNGVSRRG